MKIRGIKVIGLELVKVGLCLVVAEAALWAFGYDPSIRVSPPNPGVIGVADEGWIHKPGSYQFSDPFGVPPRTIRYTFLADGTRDSGEAGQGPVVALLGCSFLEGYWLDDTETIGWKLQRELPQRAVKNFAVRGYGTYLSLLMMRRAVHSGSLGQAPTIIYGFADFHAPRNVKNPLLQKIWGSNGNQLDGKGQHPVCDDTGCFTWSGAHVFQGLRHSRLLSLLVRAWESAVFLWQMPVAQRVTERLLLEMKDEARRQGARLIIAPTTPLSEVWKGFFNSHGFEVVWCTPSAEGTQEELLKDGHPNPVWADRFGRCLARHLETDSVPPITQVASSSSGN